MTALPVHTLRTLKEGGFTEAPKISVDDLFGDGTAFVLHNVLSEEECQYIIDQAEEAGFGPAKYSSVFRVTDAVMVMSEDVAQEIFERVKDTVVGETLDIQGKLEGNLKGLDPGTIKGTWQPIALNESLRICRYTAGGYFWPHFDYGFVRNSEERSLKTFMVYLNDDYEGGPTSFYNDEQAHYEKPDAKNVIYNLRCKAGDVLVFNPHQTHDGGSVESGKKYLLRSDVMYRLQA